MGKSERPADAQIAAGSGVINNSKGGLDSDMANVLKAIDKKQKRKVEETDLAAVKAIQDRTWRIVPAAMGGWTIQANGFDVAGTYNLENAQAILANALDRQSLLSQVDNLIEQNKRLSSIIKNHIDKSFSDR